MRIKNLLFRMYADNTQFTVTSFKVTDTVLIKRLHSDSKQQCIFLRIYKVFLLNNFKIYLKLLVKYNI